MWHSYLKRAFRHLYRNRLFSLINIGGLAIGITIAMVLFLYLDYEQNFDAFQSKADRIVRLISHSTLGDKPEKWGCSPNVAADAFNSEIPSIEAHVRMVQHNFGEPANVRANEKAFIESGVFWTDPSVSRVFDLDFISGNALTSLSKPHSIIISEDVAKKYFGTQNPLGSELVVDNQVSCLVTGVYRNIPEQSSFRPDMMGSISSIAWMNSPLVWSNASFETYFLLQKGVDYKNVEKEIDRVAKEKKPAGSNWLSFSLQPLLDIHLGSEDIQNTYVDNTGSRQSCRIASLLVFVILLIASINYMNLSTARSQKRFREVGICKTLGAGRTELVRHFYIETALMVLIAFVISILLLLFILPYFNTFAHTQLKAGQLLQGVAPGSISLSLLAIILFSGLYPALYLSSFNPKDLFRFSFRADRFNGILRYGLVVIQFSVSIVLIFSTIVFYRQLKYIESKKPGFQPERVVCFNTSGAETETQLEGLMTDLKGISGIGAVCLSQTYPGRDGSLRTLYKSNDPSRYKEIITCRSSKEVLSVLDLKLLAGKTFRETADRDAESHQLILNRTAVDFLGYTPDEAIGKRVSLIGENDEIVGVVEDFHYQSMHQPIGAYAFHNAATENCAYLMVRMSGGQEAPTLAEVRSRFSKHLPHAALDQVFLDGFLRSLYARESQALDMTFLFSGLAILLACLGLFGLSAYMIEQRLKEISLRKVLGASVTQILILISRRFILQVLLSGAIALPVSWLLMTRWLEHFAFHISIGWSIGIATLLLAVSTALLTVAFQALKTATSKPAANLRTE